MSFGFSLVTGSGSTVSINSDNDAVGVFLDFFLVPYETTVTKTYPDFFGSELFAIVMQQDKAKLNTPSTTINSTTKTVTVTSLTNSATSRQGGLTVMVLGK